MGLVNGFPLLARVEDVIGVFFLYDIMLLDVGVTVDLVHLGPTAANSLAEMTASFVQTFPARPSFAR
eukprot:2999439-Amphidinium_carterae.1